MQSVLAVNICKTCLKVRNNLVTNVTKSLKTRRLNYLRAVQKCNQPPVPLIRCITRDVQAVRDGDGLVDKISRKFKLLISKSRLNARAFILYECIADRINYPLFFKELNLPDTFYSWFVITELHVWMLMARLMAEGDSGRYLRNCIVNALWSDVQQRSKQLGAANPAGLRVQVRELSEQFQAALVAYDEGLQSDDVVLAGAVWRRIYQLEHNNVENVEKIVMYIRKQMRMLDRLSKDELLEKEIIQWESLK